MSASGNAEKCGSAEKSALLSHSVAKPVESSLLSEVRQLGHYPKRYKRPADDAQTAENSLAKRLSKALKSLPEGERERLQEMKANSAGKPVGSSLLDMVRQLGHYPKRFHRPANDQERAENVLADRVSKAWQSLPEGEREHLQEMKANSAGKPVRLSWVDDVERLGHYPQRFHRPANDEEIAEDKLARRASASLASASEGDRNHIDALHNEMQWMRERESEWAKTTNQRLRQERKAKKRRKQAAERKAKLRHLLSKLRTSKVRCDCYDFSQWQWLWRRNPELARRLRDAGHHLASCKLMQGRVEEQRGMLKHACDDDFTYARMMRILEDDEDTSPAVLEDQDCEICLAEEFRELCRKEGKTPTNSCFQCSGVMGRCASCDALITCGVFHAGRLKLLRYDENYSLTSLSSDYASLTFLHKDSCDTRLPQVSTKWEELFLPLAATPGADVGITEREYSWLLKQCRAKADWQLREYQVSWSGKLLRGRRPQVEWRAAPPDDWKSTREDEENNFRVRRQPLRQEPEWQFDDFDVAAAWKRIDPLVLDGFKPEDALAAGRKAIASLGRWPRQVIEDATAPSARNEILLASFLDAAIAKPFAFYAFVDFFEAIRCRSQLLALRLKHSLADSAQKPVDDPPVHSCLKEMVQSLGLEPQPVSASAVFRHTPAQNIRCVDLQKKALLSALGHDGFFHKLELGWQHTQPWDHFFMFNKDFRAYNEKRMTAEDPKAHMWNAHKSFVDYTWCVTASDWMAKLVELDKHEHSELDRRSGMLTEWRQSTEQKLCRVAKESVRWPVRFDEWGHESCYWDWVHAITGSEKPVLQNLGVELFEWHGQANPGCVESGKQVCPLPMQVMAEVQQWYNRRNRSDPEFRFSGPSEPYKAFDFSAKISKSIAQCIRDGRSQTKIADFLRERPWFGLSGLWPEMWKHPGSAGWRPELCFLWLGGTYARNLDLFDERQGTAGWIHTHMRPLGIQPPEAAVKSLQHSFHYKDEFRAFAEQWQRGPWIGPAPHPDAVLSPARQLLYYVRHSACQDRVSCYERSRKRTSVKDADMQSLCVSCDEAKKVKWPARGEVLFPSATAPKPPDPEVWLSNVYLRQCMKEPLREYR